MPTPLELAEQLVLLLGREQYVKDNAVTLVESLAVLVARQRAELARLNQRCEALSRERAKLVGDVQALTLQMRERELARDFEVARLRQQIEGHCDRIAKQSELLSKRAERQEAPADGP